MNIINKLEIQILCMLNFDLQLNKTRIKDVCVLIDYSLLKFIYKLYISIERWKNS